MSKLRYKVGDVVKYKGSTYTIVGIVDGFYIIEGISGKKIKISIAGLEKSALLQPNYDPDIFSKNDSEPENEFEY